jgi:hypothetical protein
MSWRWWGELYKSGKPKGLIQMRENEQKLLHYFLHSQTSFPSSLAWSFFRDSSTLYSIVMRFQLLQVIEKGNYVCMHGNGKHLGRSKDKSYPSLAIHKSRRLQLLSVACDTQIKKAAAVQAATTSFVRGCCWNRPSTLLLINYRRRTPVRRSRSNGVGELVCAANDLAVFSVFSPFYYAKSTSKHAYN